MPGEIPETMRREYHGFRALQTSKSVEKVCGDLSHRDLMAIYNQKVIPYSAVGSRDAPGSSKSRSPKPWS